MDIQIGKPILFQLPANWKTLFLYRIDFAFLFHSSLFVYGEFRQNFLWILYNILNIHCGYKQLMKQCNVLCLFHVYVVFVNFVLCTELEYCLPLACLA